MSEKQSDEQTERTCSDCGTAPVWRHAIEYPYYCRRCYGKNGYREMRTIDPDILDALVGYELADRILSECVER